MKDHKEWLELVGVKQNNLKNFSIKIPHNKVVVFTGVSGSGKSSLAYDTIFAEGQWRFIESLSSYARLFLEKLDRPDVETVKNIRPALALEQRNPVKSSRSTVGTLTEIYDLFRILYARVSDPSCPQCGAAIKSWDTTKIYNELIAKHKGSKALIIFESLESIAELRERGFYRLLINSEMKEVFEVSDKEAGEKKEVLLDRLVIKDDSRLSDSLELAWTEGNRKIKIKLIDDDEIIFTGKNICDKCNISVAEATPLLFSYNHPVAACPACRGFGNILKYDRELIVPDFSLSIEGGAVEPWEKPAYAWWREQLLAGMEKSGMDTAKSLDDFNDEEWRILYEGNKYIYGLNDFFEALEEKKYKLHVRVFLSRYRNPVVCHECNGKRLKRDALFFKIDSLDIAELSAMSVGALTIFFSDPPLSPHKKVIAKEVLRSIGEKLDYLVKVGLDYLTIDRQTMTLSGGEYQRVNLSNQLASRLAGTMYILDEPSIGLHSRDNEKISEIVKDLSDQGNSVFIVEHDPDIIGASQWVVELGPGGGHKGGNIVFNGSYNDFLKSETITSTYMNKLAPGEGEDVFFPARIIDSSGNGDFIRLTGAEGNNLKNVKINIPCEAMTVVCGVSGSGKSSLIIETLYKGAAEYFKHNKGKPLAFDSIKGIEKFKDIRVVDQSPIGKTPRSNPATYLKLFDPIRKLFSEQPEARIYGYTPGFFSFNVPGGRCETCKGEGFQKLEMYFFEEIFVKCDECHGMRYRQDALRVKYRGLNINDVLNLTVDEAYEKFFNIEAAERKLSLMRDVGLGYLKVGQPATSLSGGEAQRLKLCVELDIASKNKLLYILDEPTIGLHMHDVSSLLSVLRRLVDSGNTVIVIEHNLEVIASADWIIDLGPEGGDRGGEIVFEGPSYDIINCKESYTGKSLLKRELLSGDNSETEGAFPSL